MREAPDPVESHKHAVLDASGEARDGYEDDGQVKNAPGEVARLLRRTEVTSERDVFRIASERCDVPLHPL